MQYMFKELLFKCYINKECQILFNFIKNIIKHQHYINGIGSFDQIFV
jgi:hypothetical protein